LIEVLLVLALLAIMAAVAYPTVQGPLAHQRLMSASDNVRSALCSARTDAMMSGHTYAFRYQVRGSRFHVGLQDDPAAGESSSPPPPQSGSSEGGASHDPNSPRPIDGVLPSGVRFLSNEGELASMGDKPALDKPGASANQGEGWSEPIYFYPDGTSSDAKFLLAGDRHSAVRLTLRGITATVKVNDSASKTE
jgi:type II secretory pathway pseudopilin PulG